MPILPSACASCGGGGDAACGCYNEDTPHVSGDEGTFVLAVRNDAGTPLAGDGDYSPLQVNAAGELRVTTAAGAAPVGRDDTDDQAPVATGLNTVVNRLYAFDGANWDRVRSGATPGSIIVDQGTSPWVVSGTVTANQGTSPWVTSLDAATLAALETITVLQGASPWVVSGTVELGVATLAALETITVLQGTSPWVVSGTVTSDVTFDYAEDSLHVSGDVGAFVLAVRNDDNSILTSTDGDYSPFSVTDSGALNIADAGGSITVDGEVELGPASLAALETVTVLQGTSPWVVSGTVAVTQSTSPWVVSGTVELGAATLAALETITVLQGTSPWVVSGTVTSDVAFDYAEDSAHVSGDVGAFVLAVRNDANAVLTTTNGDYSPFSVTSTGALNIADGGGSITVDGTVELGAATLAALETITVLQGTSPWVVSGTVAVTQSTSPWVISGTVTADTELPAASALTDADPNPTTSRIGANQLVFNGATWDRVRSGTALGSVLVNNPVAANFLSTVTQGTSPWVVGAEKAEDSGHVSGATGNFILAVRNDAGTSLVNADLDYAPLQVDSSGALRIAGTLSVGGTARDDTDDQAPVATGAGLQVVRDYVYDAVGNNWDRARSGRDDTDGQTTTAVGAALTVGRSYIFNAVTGWERERAASADNLTTGVPVAGNYVFDGATWDRKRDCAVVGMQGVGGAEAHDAPVTGNPVLTGGRGSNVAPTAVSADGDVVRDWTTLNGRQRVYSSGRRRQGVYAITFTSTVTAAADAATVGRGWLVNNTGSVIVGALRRVSFTGTTTTGLLTPTAPIFQVERITFTGTPSGAQITPCKRDSTDPANTLTWRTASTGMTITAGAALTGFQMGGSLLATNMMTPMQYWPIFGDEDGYIVLRPGEGIVIRQSTAGTVADTRAANFDVAWEEYNAADFTIRD